MTADTTHVRADYRCLVTITHGSLAGYSLSQPDQVVIIAGENVRPHLIVLLSLCTPSPAKAMNVPERILNEVTGTQHLSISILTKAF